MNKILTFLALLAIATSSYADGFTQKKVETVIVPQKTVQFDADYFRGTDYYYSLGQKFVREKDKATEDEVKELKAKLDLLIQLYASGALKPGQPIPPVLPQPEEPKKVDDIDSRIIALWNKRCVNCHGAVPQNNGLSLVKNNELVDLSLEERLITYDRVYGYKLEERGLAKMPKGGSLTDEEVNLVYEWLIKKAYGGK